MDIRVVDHFDAFLDLKEDWDAVYAADPDAHFFVSWVWFENWLQHCNDDWLILVATPRAEARRAVAFFPLRILDRKWEGGWFYNELGPACGFADYAGLLCRPEVEAEALAAFWNHLERLTWARINIEFLRISDRRLSLLLRPSEATETRVSDRHVQDGVDLFKCPYVDLPVDWDSYLANHLSANSRQKVRRFLRRVERDESYRITHADSTSIERDIEILLDLWDTRWATQKGERRDEILRTIRLMLAGCFNHDALIVPILWNGDRPLAALALLRDAQKKALSFFVGGRDRDFKEIPCAFVLHAHSIRYAIAEGFRTYDFLVGDEAYKYAFATSEYHLKGAVVTTKDRRNLGGKLARRSLPFVFKHSADLHRKGQLAEAAMGYRQILEVEPRFEEALLGLGQVLAAQGDVDAAIDTVKTYLAIDASPSRDTLVDRAAIKPSIEASATGKPITALALLMPFADAGDGKAQAAVARALFHGDGAAMDRAAAARYAAPAAHAGNAEAQQYLARLYFLGDGGLKKDHSQAFEWARKSAEAGNRYGQALIGKFYMEGVGVAKDTARAAHWWRKSATQNYAQAILRLGRLYELGEGVPKDTLAAYTLYRSAMLRGAPKAQEAADRLAPSLEHRTRRAADGRAKEGWLPSAE